MKTSDSSCILWRLRTQIVQGKRRKSTFTILFPSRWPICSFFCLIDTANVNIQNYLKLPGEHVIKILTLG